MDIGQTRAKETDWMQKSKEACGKVRKKRRMKLKGKKQKWKYKREQERK